MSNDSVEVTIGGHRLLVSSDHSHEYTREVAAHFDRAIQQIRSQLPSIDAHRATLLAGMAITDELMQSRQGGTTLAPRIEAVIDRLARLLPPTKRGTRAQPPVVQGS